MEIGGRHGIAVRGRRRFRSRGFRGRGADAARPYRRADQLRLRRSGGTADRRRAGRWARRGRLSARRSRRDRRAARRAGKRCPRRAGRLPDLRSGRHVRARPCRMPGAAAQGARPLRSGDCGAGRQSRPARPPRFRGAAPDMRRRRGRPGRHGGRDQGAQPAPRHGLFGRLHRHDRCRRPDPAGQ